MLQMQGGDPEAIRSPARLCTERPRVTEVRPDEEGRDGTG
jgi:hypothetical protein